MAFEAKAAFLSETEKKLSEMITAADLNRVMRALSDTLAGYDMVRTAIDESDGSDDLLEAYIAALQVSGRSEGTIAGYRRAIERLAECTRTPTRQITVYHIRKFLADEKARGISDRTLESTRQRFSAYFNWLQREGLIERNPTANLGSIKYAKKEKDVYSEADIEKLKFACGNIRDRAIVCFLRATGCRVSEMTGLDRDDVDLAAMECRVLGKGNKERTVYMDQVCVLTLQQYLDTRTDDEPMLFRGKRGRLTPTGIRKMLNELADQSGVDHVHPHKFRRTAATNLIRHGMPLQEVAAILGHDKLDTTMQYVVLDKTQIRNEYRRYA